MGGCKRMIGVPTIGVMYGELIGYFEVYPEQTVLLIPLLSRPYQVIKWFIERV